MTRFISLKVGISVLAMSIAGIALSASSTTAQMQQLAQSARQNVIVIMRDQLESVPPMRRAMGARAAAIVSAQVPVLNQLQQGGPRKVLTFSTINAFATSVTAAEKDSLAAHPMVLAVVPDRVISAPRRPEVSAARAANSNGVNSNWSTGDSSDGGLCNTLEPQALQLTHTAFLDRSIPQAQEVVDGNGQKVTGKGVKVAWIADGMDPTIAGFTRPDGSPVFVDYQDFSGDPAGTVTPGAEAFGDASSIAAQDMPNGKPLIYDISQFVNQTHPLPSPCNIRIRGMAPGASLVGLKVFSNISATTNSQFVQAIEYAVVHDDVDVINESFGGAPFPDQANDPISLADSAAIRAGVVVVVSTGDAGTNGTLGSPSTDPDVIAAGASTQFRIYEQISYGAQALADGVVSNNISAFSSGGFAQRTPRTVDVVAPGDLGWALCSTNVALFSECFNFQSPALPTPIQDFGGTSESSPLTAGEAALVIQAYRSTHHGNDPTPALVKQIIMSTATDLFAPTSEQGAGLINSLAAVNVALSVVDGNGKPKIHSGGILANPASARITSEPGTRESRSFSITNTGSTTQHLTPTLETLGPPIAGKTININLDPADLPTFLNPTGAPRSYTSREIKVPAGAEHLDVALAFQTPLSGPATLYVYLGLLDPSGKQVAYSIPQGATSGYAHVDVVKPVAGQWTVLVWTRPPGVTGSYTGPVQLTWAAENYVKMGTVHPASLDLAPGATEFITAEFNSPSQPGDLAAGIRFRQASSWSGTEPEIPVTLRTLVQTGPTGGNFTGTLTGGNGRPGTGPTQTFEFDVPKGVNNMSLVLTIPDSGYLLEGLVVDPNGMELSVEPNIDPSGNVQGVLQHFRTSPQPGRWKFVLLQNFTSSGNQTSLQFSARIAFNSANVTAPGLPGGSSTLLSASGGPVTIAINVTNTGGIGQLFFADARLGALGQSGLPQFGCDGIFTLQGACGFFYVPPETSSVQFVAQSVVPINADAFNDVGYNIGFTGSPDIYAIGAGPNTVVASLSEPEIPFGGWVVFPSLVGPFGAAGAPTEPVTMNGFGLMQQFDAAAAADSGDIWSDIMFGTNTFNPLLLAPGQSGVINLTITPDATQVGKVVSGFVYIDTWNPTVQSGDEMVRIPYSYTIAP
ncbi:MAG: S8 family serine peptidase [Steroidobacteraceae bacterium]